MAKYRKKPVVIEAFEYGIDRTELPLWFRTAMYDGKVEVFTQGDLRWCEIPTLEGTMRGEVGDYIIKGVKGEFYPIKKDIFFETYELVEAAMPNVHPHCKPLPASANNTGRKVIQDGLCHDF